MEPRAIKHSNKSISEKKPSSIKRKVATLVVAGSILFGGSLAFGASPLLGNISSFFQGILTGENNELVSEANSTETSAVTQMETFLTGLKNRISTELGSWNDSEKERTEQEITQYNNDLQTEADTQATTDITNGKSQLTNTANTEIQETKDSLDNKYQEIFPTPAP